MIPLFGRKPQASAVGPIGRFAPLGLPRLAEAAGAALACIVVNDLIGIIWRWLAARAADRGAPE